MDQYVINMLTEAVFSFDPGLRKHSFNTRKFAVAISKAMGMPPAYLELVAVAAELHDIGKFCVPRSIINKPDRLTPEEFEIVKRHPTVGESIIRQLPEMTLVAKIVRHHHERWDGDGYPDGLLGEKIPLGSRIIGVVDAFAAMTNHRVYAPHVTNEAAFAEIVAHSGTQFDPLVVATFAKASDHGGRWIA